MAGHKELYVAPSAAISSRYLTLTKAQRAGIHDEVTRLLVTHKADALPVVSAIP